MGRGIQKTKQVGFSGLLLFTFACGGKPAEGVQVAPRPVESSAEDSSAAESSSLSSAPVASAPVEAEVRAVIVEPTPEEEAQGGVRSVTISSDDGLSTWLGSPAFSELAWLKGDQGKHARYRVVFVSDGDARKVYFIGTTKTSRNTYRCYGFCEPWWVAPALPSGEQDFTRYRLIAEQEWQPLAREWYLADKDKTQR
jgi:hypothetical protein